MSKENTQLGIWNGPKNTLKLFSQDAFFFEANLTRKKRSNMVIIDHFSMFKYVLDFSWNKIQKHNKICTHRVKSDLRVSEQPDTAENSETKVERW